MKLAPELTTVSLEHFLKNFNATLTDEQLELGSYRPALVLLPRPLDRIADVRRETLGTRSITLMTMRRGLLNAFDAGIDKPVRVETVRIETGAIDASSDYSGTYNRVILTFSDSPNSDWREFGKERVELYRDHPDGGYGAEEIRHDFVKRGPLWTPADLSDRYKTEWF